MQTKNSKACSKKNFLTNTVGDTKPGYDCFLHKWLRRLIVACYLNLQVGLLKHKVSGGRAKKRYLH